MSSLEDARREILDSLEQGKRLLVVRELDEGACRVTAGLVPPHLKVSCPFGGGSGACKSPSKRDVSKPKRAWVCGSGFSHDDRLGCCIAYRRLQSGLSDGVSGNRRFSK